LCTESGDSRRCLNPLHVVADPIPEPAIIGPVFLMLAGLGAWERRRRK